MKQDNNDIFNIDFNNKDRSEKTKKNTDNSDFFDFSITNKKPISDKDPFHEEFAEETPVEEIASESEVSTTPVEEESPVEEETSVVAETPVEEETPVVAEIPVEEETPASEEQAPEAEIPSPAVVSVPEKGTADIEDDSVTITVVNWHKKAQTNTHLYKKANASPTAVPTASTKKKSLVIETDDGFEIKICNFRDLANK